jgi:hypothetical protein
MGDADDSIKGLTWNSNLKIVVWILYFITTALMVIIMLNLLISIIGDSYEKVTALERNNFNYERASSLRDIELTMS